MDNSLFAAIGDVDDLKSDMLDIDEAMQKLSNFPVATAHLIHAYKKTMINAETLWREIEQTEEFQTTYQNREQAINDFYRIKSKRVNQ